MWSELKRTYERFAKRNLHKRYDRYFKKTVKMLESRNLEKRKEYYVASIRACFDDNGKEVLPIELLGTNVHWTLLQEWFQHCLSRTSEITNFRHEVSLSPHVTYCDEIYRMGKERLARNN